jgi:hypothetical protein
MYGNSFVTTAKGHGFAADMGKICSIHGEFLHVRVIREISFK